MVKIIFKIIISFILIFRIILFPFKPVNPTVHTVETNGSLTAVDSLGRSVTTAGESEKQVGVFYFLWLGSMGKHGPFDITKLLNEHPDAVESVEKWEMYGGPHHGQPAFWSEPLFGYYNSYDTWVIRKHCQMLTDAKVDFIVFDTTNALIYEDRVEDVISVWYEYFEEGLNVPKIAFYTNTESGKTMNGIYDLIYNNTSLYEKYPKLNELWYKLDGKPMIIGNKSDKEMRNDVKAYFRIKDSQWPNEEKKDDGFPWIEFDRNLKMSSYYKNSFSDKSVMCVSPAQHINNWFSNTAFYNIGDCHGRSWHNGKKDTSENAILYGYNFEEQWDHAIRLNPDIIFVTGFNEWVAQRINPSDQFPIIFVDNCTEEYSRDFEPSAGILGDNYYMQLVRNIARFKASTEKLPEKDYCSIDINGSFEQWNSNKIKAVYKDYKNDTVDRDCDGQGSLYYKDTSGRNDIVNAKACEDRENVYFYVDTANSLTPSSDRNWMTLFLNISGKKDGYDYVINRLSPESGNTEIEKIVNGKYESVGEAKIKFEGNKLMIAVKKDDLSLPEKASFDFKWADNYFDASNIFSFYKTGDAAPYGRLNWHY